MKYIVSFKENGERFDKAVSLLNSELSRSYITKLIEEGKILLNGKKEKPSLKVKENDEIFIEELVDTKSDIKEEDIPLDVVYEDSDILVINKPQGMVVHPANGHYSGTLVNALMFQADSLSSINGVIRPGIVHRIDKDTSGLMIVCKDNKVHPLLAEGFKNKTIKRDYIALLVGEFPHASATINAPIGRDSNNRKMFTVTDKNSKDAITEMKVLKRYIGYTLVKCSLKTGRTHQIRVHMKYIGYPVYNDPVYTNAKATKFGQFLHSAHLEFVHPITKEALEFDAPLPNEFQKFIDNLEEYEKI